MQQFSVLGLAIAGTLVLATLLAATAIACGGGGQPTPDGLPSPSATVTPQPLTPPPVTAAPVSATIEEAIHWTASGCINTPMPVIEREWLVSAPRRGLAHILLPEGGKMESWMTPSATTGVGPERESQLYIEGRIRPGDYSVRISLSNKWGEPDEVYDVLARVIAPDGTETTATSVVEWGNGAELFYPADFEGARPLSAGTYTIIWEIEAGFVACDGFVIESE